MPNSIIVANGVQKIFKTKGEEIHAVQNLDLVIEKGEFVVLAGPSGSGKTTILNMLGALDTPTSGSINLLGHGLESMDAKALRTLRREKLGFIFQAYNLIDVLTAEENVSYILEIQTQSYPNKEKKVEEVLKTVGLWERRKHFPQELSGGQQQRVAIARALVLEPPLILADEPTANLDSKTAISLIETMLKLNKEQGITFLFSSHDQKIIDRAPRVLWLEDGILKEDRRK